MPKPASTMTNALQEDMQSNSVQKKAELFITALQQSIAHSRLKWHAPTVTHNEAEDSMEISWWRADKSLIITIEPDSPITYLKVWGPNIHHEMEEGQDTSAAHLTELWQWLYA